MQTNVVLPESIQKDKDVLTESELHGRVTAYLSQSYPHYELVRVEGKRIVCKEVDSLF